MSSYKQIALDFYNKGVICYQRGDLNGAVTNWTEALRHQPDFVEALENCGSAYREKRNLDEALNSLNQAIRLQPGRPSLYYNRALVYADKKDLTQAISDYTKALAINPQYPDAHCNRGILYMQRGELEKAQTDLTTALRINPNDAIAREALRRIGQLATKIESTETRGFARLPVLIQEGFGKSQTLTPQQVLKVLGKFFYTYFDASLKPTTQVERLQIARPGQKGLADATAIALELSHTPGLVIWVTLEPTSCLVMLLQGQNAPDYKGYLLGLSAATHESIPSHADALLACLNGFVAKGLLVKAGERLKYAGPPASPQMGTG